MPVLQHKLTFRDVFKYDADVTVLDKSGDEVQLKLLYVVRVGDEGKLAVEPRLVERSGPLSNSLSEPFLKAGERVVNSSGACQEGLISLAFLPVLSEQTVEVGSHWTVNEGGALVDYELTALDEDSAEIVSRKEIQDTKGRPVSVESLFEFSREIGRVVSAQVVSESPRVRIIAEYQLQ